MITLGWHGSIRREHEDMAQGWAVHDGAAVLLKDGELLAAIEEERLNRIKHSNFFPRRALRACLESGDMGLDEVDCVAVNFDERTRDIFATDIGLPATDLYLEETHRTGHTVRDMVSDLFRAEFSADVSRKLYFCNHHVAHLWSAWGPSQVSDALVVSFDGSGDGLSGMVAVGSGNRPLDARKEFIVEQSLGNMYADTIRLIGYRRFDEYKAMGLAPYGDPSRFQWLFSQFYRLLADGDYWLADRRERWAKFYDAGLISQARRAGAPFAALHADIAAALQATLETVAMHVLSQFQRSTGQRNLCYAGGVAHNCTLNGKILYSGLFDSVYVQPAAHDAGGALGAALAAEHELAGPSAKPGTSRVFTGRDLGNTSEVFRELRAWQNCIAVEEVADPSAAAADLIASGLVIGWVQGRSEFGPRALGHRSILADPRPASNKDRINSMVKKRESFRPFAPAVRDERMSDVFQLPTTQSDYSYMTFTLYVNEEARERLGAVTHVDGSARLQSVSRHNNERFWQLIADFEQITGVPAVLNTSFNNNAEPIVDSAYDAVTCFLTTGLDALVIDRFLVRKHPEPITSAALGLLRPSLAKCRKLVRRSRIADDGTMMTIYCVESTASRYFVDPTTQLSESAFSLLLRANGHLMLNELYHGCGTTNTDSSALDEEFYSLWQARAISFAP